MLASSSIARRLLARGARSLMVSDWARPCNPKANALAAQRWGVGAGLPRAGKRVQVNSGSPQAPASSPPPGVLMENGQAHAGPAVEAQAPGKVWRLAVLTHGSRATLVPQLPRAGTAATRAGVTCWLQYVGPGGALPAVMQGT